MEPSHIFRLSFDTNFGEVANINIPLANTNVTREQVIAAMNEMILSNSVANSRGEIRHRRSARVDTIAKTNFSITPSSVTE